MPSASPPWSSSLTPSSSFSPTSSPLSAARQGFHRLNMEVDLQSLFGLHVTWCAQLYSFLKVATENENIRELLIKLRNICNTEYIFYCKRAILFLSSSKILTPHPPLRPASLSSPRNKGGGTQSPGGEGDGGSIFWKTREIGLPSYSKICTLWFVSFEFKGG